MFWRPLSDGVSVAVKVQPRSRRPGVHGTGPSAVGERLHIGVTEPTESGRANRAVCATLAKRLDLAPPTVSVVIGTTSREKTLRVTGDPAELGAKLAAL